MVRMTSAVRRGKLFSIYKLPGFTFIAVACFLMLYAPIMILVVLLVQCGLFAGPVGRLFVAMVLSAPGRTKRCRMQLCCRSLSRCRQRLYSTVLATMAALGTTRTRPFRGQTAIYTMINQPLMVPEIVTAVALLIVFASIKQATGYQGLSYLVIAHTAFCIPFAYLPIRARLEDMDRSLETAAADLYATPWRCFRRVTLPLLWPGILAGAMLAFVISLDDVVITEFVKSAGQDTLPTFMLGQLRRVITPEMNAIASALLAVSVLMVSLIFLINRKKT